MCLLNTTLYNSPTKFALKYDLGQHVKKRHLRLPDQPWRKECHRCDFRSWLETDVMVHYSRVHGAEHEQDRENVPDNSQVEEEAKRREFKVKKEVNKTEVEVKKEAEVEKMVTGDKPAAEKSGLDQQRQIKDEGDAQSTKMEVDEVKRKGRCEELERPPSKKQKPEKREEWVTKTPSQPPKATTESPKALPQPSTAPKEPTKAKSQPTTSTTSHAPNATSQPQKAPAQQPPKSSEPALAGMSKTAPPKMGKIELLPIQKTGTEVIDIDDSDEENGNAMDAPKKQDKKSSEPALAGPSKDAPPKKGSIQLVPIQETGTLFNRISSCLSFGLN